ncbi:MAG: 50S ribosomal protein L4 [Methanomassiliicoccales archaeon]
MTQETQLAETQELPEGHVFIYDREGKPSGDVELPAVFKAPFRPDLIRRDTTAMASARRHPYGPYKEAGMRHSVETWGKGRGVARVQRIKGLSNAAESPNNVGGRRAHPPRPERVWIKKINRKERVAARRSALACLSDISLVRGRGHIFEGQSKLPLVVVDDVESMEKAVDVEMLLARLGVIGDILRVRRSRHIRAGKGKMRNRRYREAAGPLIIVSSKDAPVFRAVSNLAGVDVATPASFNTEMLAPGGVPGRLAIFTLSALKKLEGM